jgi:hypothetical protein
MIEDFYVELTRKTPTYSKNSRAENIKAYSSGTTINGYIGSRVDIPLLEGGKRTIKTQYKFFSDTECNFDDIIVYNNENYIVKSDMQNTIHANHHFKGYVEKFENID